MPRIWGFPKALGEARCIGEFVERAMPAIGQKDLGSSHLECGLYCAVISVC